MPEVAFAFAPRDAIVITGAGSDADQAGREQTRLDIPAERTGGSGQRSDQPVYPSAR